MSTVRVRVTSGYPDKVVQGLIIRLGLENSSVYNHYGQGRAVRATLRLVRPLR